MDLDKKQDDISCKMSWKIPGQFWFNKKIILHWKAPWAVPGLRSSRLPTLLRSVVLRRRCFLSLPLTHETFLAPPDPQTEFIMFSPNTSSHGQKQNEGWPHRCWHDSCWVRVLQTSLPLKIVTFCVCDRPDLHIKSDIKFCSVEVPSSFLLVRNKLVLIHPHKIVGPV